MIVGKYAFVFCGANDVGTGWFAVGQDGSVIGADIGNVTYNGTAREGDDGWITLDLELTIPAGTTLVQGTAAQDVPHNRNLHAYLPPFFGDGHPQQIPAGPGVATIIGQSRRSYFVCSTFQFVLKTVSHLCTPWVTRRNLEPKLPAVPRSTIML